MSITDLFDKKFKLVFLLIFIFEILSFIAYFFPILNSIIFFIVALIAFLLTLKKLEYGLYILLAELFVGSFGYLFYFSFPGVTLSLRIALWLIVMSVWLAKTLIVWYKNKKLTVAFRRSAFFEFYLILFVFIFWGMINGLLHNDLGYLLSDGQRWLYFALILPVYEVIKDERFIKNILNIFLAAITWLGLETITLLYLFSHNFNGLILTVYRWVRLTEVGEITQVRGGFFRIFLQSHIYVLIAFFVISLILTYLIKRQAGQSGLFKDKYFSLFLGSLSLTLTAVLISFSRSFWLGLGGGLVSLWLIWLIKFKLTWRKFIFMNSWLLLTAIIGFLAIVLIVKFPLPEPIGGFDTASLFSDRATAISGEAGASSRWSLLPALWSKIGLSPVLGQGFGSTVTYVTNDPRIVESTANGLYTTYAFEWGWLDIWLKIGLIGLAAYLALLIRIIILGLKFISEKLENTIILGFVLGLSVLTIVSFFSPYTNHPLGIGFIILASAILDYYCKQPKALA